MIFWNALAFFDDPMNVGNLISGSSAFSKTSLSIWKLTVHILLRPGLENFEHYLLLGRKVMTNLDSIFKSRDITLPTKACLVKAMVFPVVMYGCESWTVKKAEH